MRKDSVQYNEMSYLYDRLMGECKLIPDIFKGGHGRAYDIDPFKPYPTYNVAMGITFKVWRNHNVVGTVCVKHDGEKFKVDTPYHQFTAKVSAVRMFKIINDVVISLYNNSSEDFEREWGNRKFTSDISW